MRLVQAWTGFEDFAQQYVGSGLDGGHNYCRNPDQDSTVWCFTGSDGSWNYCDVSRCDKEVSDTNFKEHSLMHAIISWYLHMTISYTAENCTSDDMCICLRRNVTLQDTQQTLIFLRALNGASLMRLRLGQPILPALILLEWMLI